MKSTSQPTYKPKVTPIYQTSVYTFEDLNELEAYFEDPGQHYMYTRYGHPNADEFAQSVADLEQGMIGAATSSGMSAILAAILSYCQSGDHIICAEDIYGGSITLLHKELSRLGIQASFLTSEELHDLHTHVKNNTKLVYVETISNPLLKVHPLAHLAQIAHHHGLPLIVDNTFATPIITRPLELGADMVVHSVTKFLSGHSDVTAGVLVTRDEQQGLRVREMIRNYGFHLNPFESWLATRGLKTLRLRMQQHCDNALQIAQFLRLHPLVQHTFYPGLSDHPDFVLASEQGNGLFGGVLSFKLVDDKESVNAFIRQVQRFPFAPSLAGVDSSLSHPLSTSHRSLSIEQQHKLGITQGLIRLSVGIEECELLLADLEQALGG